MPHGKLVCYEELARNLIGYNSSVPWIDDGHYKLVGRPGGTIDVYIP